MGNLVISLFGAFLSGVFSVCTSCASKLLKWTTLVEYYTDVIKIRMLSDSFNKKTGPFGTTVGTYKIFCNLEMLLDCVDAVCQI